MLFAVPCYLSKRQKNMLPFKLTMSLGQLRLYTKGKREKD